MNKVHAKAKSRAKSRAFGRARATALYFLSWGLEN